MTKKELLLDIVARHIDTLESYTEITFAKFTFNTEECENIEVEIDFTKDENFVTAKIS